MDLSNTNLFAAQLTAMIEPHPYPFIILEIGLYDAVAGTPAQLDSIGPSGMMETKICLN